MGRLTAVFAMLLVSLGACAAERARDVRFDVDVVLEGLEHPVAMVFPSPTSALVAERRSARIRSLDLASGSVATLSGGFETLAVTGDDAGLLDLALHPQFAANGWIYATHSTGHPERSTLAVDRFRVRSGRIVDRERIFVADAWSEDRYHYGGRMAFLDGYLFVTIGDRHHQTRSQDLFNHAGKIVRLHDDGRVPRDNPFAGEERRLPEIWSYGHRNGQGLLAVAEKGELWEHEHGPLGGDELNVIRRGANYGWPVISYGWEYSGGPIGMGITQRDGMEQPVWVWTPAIAPSGLVLYTGDRFPSWRGSFLIGSMAQRHLNRIVMEQGRVVLEERILLQKAGRVRLVAEGPDGHIYIGNDNGQLLRLRPAEVATRADVGNCPPKSLPRSKNSPISMKPATKNNAVRMIVGDAGRPKAHLTNEANRPQCATEAPHAAVRADRSARRPQGHARATKKFRHRPVRSKGQPKRLQSVQADAAYRADKRPTQCNVE